MGPRLVEAVVRRGPVCERHDLFRCLPRIIGGGRPTARTHRLRNAACPVCRLGIFRGPGVMTVQSGSPFARVHIMKQGGHNEAALFRIAPPDRLLLEPDRRKLAVLWRRSTLFEQGVREGSSPCCARRGDARHGKRAGLTPPFRFEWKLPPVKLPSGEPSLRRNFLPVETFCRMNLPARTDPSAA